MARYASHPASHRQLPTLWGLLPENATPDPSTIEPISEASWIMDLDMSTAAHSPFAADAICQTAGAFAERMKKWLELVPTGERFVAVHGMACMLQDMTAADYVNSDRLDLDHLSP